MGIEIRLPLTTASELSAMPTSLKALITSTFRIVGPSEAASAVRVGAAESAADCQVRSNSVAKSGQCVRRCASIAR